jgi:hypothetical protein
LPLAMAPARRRGRARAFALAASCLVVAGSVLTGCTPAPVVPPEAAPPVAPGDVVRARKQLDGLQVRAWRSMRGYSRAKFPHWTERPDGCDTRAVVLRRDAAAVRGDRPCPVRSGRWVSPYDGEVHTVAAGIDIDHMVPLANAWRSGADRWSTAQRQRFANDLRNPQLVAVTASVNRSKGDQGPEAWKPPSTGYWCRYALDWIAVKAAYRLSVTRAERAALAGMLGHCQTAKPPPSNKGAA